MRLPITILALAGVWLAMLIFGTGPLDRAVYEALYSGNRSALVSVATFFTWLGEPTFLIAASIALGAWIWWKGHRRLALAVTLITLFARVLNEAQKMWIARVRPELEHHLVVVKTMSFPSGHSTSSMVFYLTMALALTQGSRWRHVAVAAALLMAFCVGVSRVMLGVHWPSDVIGGWSFGALWVLLTLRMADRYVARGTTG
jgi:undecaprenyl-diphosphatase